MDMDNGMAREWREAIQAGEQALSSLYAARDELRKARSWGVFDIMGGGFLTGLMKHSRIDSASEYMEAARDDLYVFERELKDIALHENFAIEISDFLKFADYFFDGFLADFMVQSKITDALGQVERAIFEVTNLLERLKGEQL